MKLYGLIGNPLIHSFSAFYFNRKFSRSGTDEKYKNFELPEIGDIMEMLAENPSLRGFNVTRPYKQQVISYLDGMSRRAHEVGAVNVVKIIGNLDSGDFKLWGYNTDVVGFKESLKPLLTPHIRKALILGTGGASLGVKCALKELGITWDTVSRQGKDGSLRYEEVDEKVIDHHRLIINTTPLGTYPDVDSFPAIPYQFITPHHLCFDLVYHPGLTSFLRKSQQQGARVKNGLEMLLIQAEESYKIWIQ